MATPAECLLEPTELRGTLRNGKMAELRLESGILGITAASFCFSFFAIPVYGGFVYLARSRWALGANGHPAERLPEPHDAPRNATERYNGGITNRIHNFTDSRIGL